MVHNGSSQQQPAFLSVQDYASLQNTFKVSHLVQPKHYKTSEKLHKLLKPKSVAHKSRRYENAYDCADFRGLLHADFGETITEAFRNNEKKQTASIVSDKQLNKNTQAQTTAGSGTGSAFQTTEYDHTVFQNFMQKA